MTMYLWSCPQAPNCGGTQLCLCVVPVVHSSKIADTFRDFYVRLCNLHDTLPGSKEIQKTERILQYLEDAQFPQISSQTRTQLNIPISLTELVTVVKDLPKGKSPGPDDFSNAYYCKFHSFLSSHMCNYFNALASGSAVPMKAFLSHITIIPKDLKDHTIPGNFRPISLLNMDIKILARILVNRLKPILPTIVHPNQTGLIAGREVRDNSNQVIQLIHWAEIQTDQPPCLLLSTDARKGVRQVGLDLPSNGLD